MWVKSGIFFCQSFFFFFFLNGSSVLLGILELYTTKYARIHHKVERMQGKIARICQTRTIPIDMGLCSTSMAFQVLTSRVVTIFV